jgi:hypothetical protein
LIRRVRFGADPVRFDKLGNQQHGRSGVDWIGYRRRRTAAVLRADGPLYVGQAFDSDVELGGVLRSAVHERETRAHDQAACAAIRDADALLLDQTREPGRRRGADSRVDSPCGSSASASTTCRIEDGDIARSRAKVRKDEAVCVVRQGYILEQSFFVVLCEILLVEVETSMHRHDQGEDQQHQHQQHAEKSKVLVFSV